MKDSSLENENILLKHINTIDLILKSLYEKKSTIEKAFSKFSNSIDIHFLPDKMMTQENVIKICHNFIKREFKKMNEKIKGKSTLKNVIYDFNSLIKHAKDFNKGRKYIQFIELIGNLIFNSNGINCDFSNETKTEKEKAIELIKIYDKKKSDYYANTPLGNNLNKEDDSDWLKEIEEKEKRKILKNPRRPKPKRNISNNQNK